MAAHVFCIAISTMAWCPAFMDLPEKLPDFVAISPFLSLFHLGSVPRRAEPPKGATDRKRNATFFCF
jgi:hypothetical protein